MYPFEVVYEDNHLIAVNKPVGLPSQSDKSGDRDLMSWVKQYLKEKYKKPGDVFLGLIHRIDRPTSGLIILAKTSKALSRMTRLFHDRQIEKHYLAASHKCPNRVEATLEHYMYKDSRKNKSFITKKSGNSKLCSLKYRLIFSQDKTHFFHVQPKTGRSHQIRVQMAYVSAPLLGDRKYGGLEMEKHQYGLHASVLRFIHPVKKESIEIKCLPRFANPWTEFLEYHSDYSFDSF